MGRSMNVVLVGVMAIIVASSIAECDATSRGLSSGGVGDVLPPINLPPIVADDVATGSIAPVAGGITPILEPVAGGITPILEPVAGAITPILEPVAGAITPILEPVIGGVLLPSPPSN